MGAKNDEKKKNFDTILEKECENEAIIVKRTRLAIFSDKEN